MPVHKHSNAMLVWDDSKTAMQQKLGEMVQYFQVSQPVDGSGVPKAYMDPTVILPYLIQAESPDDIPDNAIMDATVPIEIMEGIPTVGGIPIWERLSGEPLPYYKLFSEYLELKYTAAAGYSRAITKLVEPSGMSGKQLSALARTYHWQMRAKQYDKYKTTQLENIRAREAQLLESKHAKVSNQLLDQAVEYLTAHPEQLSPKTAIELVKLSMGAGRLALGMHPDRPGDGGSSGGGKPSVHIINQNTNATDGSTINQANLTVNGIQANSDAHRQALEKAQDVTHLQGIINVLNKSGALQHAVNQMQPDEDPEHEEAEHIVNADYEVQE